MMKSLIIRHAHRKQMPIELGYDVVDFDEGLVSISEEGHLAAIEIGKSLSSNYDFICYSYILRCKQTASAINSSGTLKNIGESEFLISEYFGNLSQYNENEKQIAIESLLNREDYFGIGLHKKMGLILDFFKENNKLSNGIYVSHDWWMALFLSYFTDLFKRDGYNIWPNFIEYFEIDFAHNLIVYRNKNIIF